MAANAFFENLVYFSITIAELVTGQSNDRTLENVFNSVKGSINHNVGV